MLVKATLPQARSTTRSGLAACYQEDNTTYDNSEMWAWIETDCQYAKQELSHSILLFRPGEILVQRGMVHALRRLACACDGSSTVSRVSVCCAETSQMTSEWQSKWRMIYDVLMRNPASMIWCCQAQDDQ
eukprot:scaffold39814_cov44-Prasinocladus_malaysianus.AAC.2